VKNFPLSLTRTSLVDLLIPHGLGNLYNINTLEHLGSAVTIQEQGTATWNVESNLGNVSIS